MTEFSGDNLSAIVVLAEAYHGLSYSIVLNAISVPLRIHAGHEGHVGVPKQRNGGHDRVPN